MSVLKNKIDFVYIFDVQDGNPNGDPDAGNLPRIDVESRSGLVTDVCLKRKVRNYVQVAKAGQVGYDIFIKERAVLDEIVEQVYDEVQVKAAAKDKQKKTAKDLLCSLFYDIRAFGAVIATSGKQDQVRGPIQLTFARSVDPITTTEHSITRMAVTKKADMDKERTMGRKSTVPYGLYVCHGFISANLARHTGFSEADLELFFDALKNMFDNDRSASRGLMSAQRLIVFRHESELGNAPANKLFDLIDIKRKTDDAARSFKDYTITVDTTNLPQGISIEEKI